MNERDIIHMVRQVGKQIGHPFAALTILLELPLRTDHSTFILVPPTAKRFHLDCLAIQGIQLRLVIKRIDVAGPAIHEKEDDILGLRCEMRRFGHHRALPIRLSVGSECLL